MKCPVCAEIDLVMTERQGVEIDYCPKCRGVWLDRGELDKIIERAGPEPSAGKRPVSPQWDQRPREDDHRRPDDEHYRRGRKSWLSELFD